MRAVFTVPGVTVGCDARSTDAGPGRLHLNVCVCGRIESIAGRKPGLSPGASRPGTVECARDRALNYREAGSERACGARANHDQQGRKPLRHLGVSRGDGRQAFARTLCLLRSRFTEFWGFEDTVYHQIKKEGRLGSGIPGT